MKIFVTGLACSGKSTLAKQLSHHAGLPLYHLDSLLWKSNWERASVNEFQRLQNEILAKENWVYEGLNPETLVSQIKAADVIVFLKKSHPRITFNWFKRLWVYRNQPRPDMAAGNTEKFSLGYLKWLWKYDSDQIIDRIVRLKNDKELIVLTNSASVKRYMIQLAKPST